MRAGSWRFATSLLDQASYQHLLELMLSPTTVVEARATYGRADGQGTFVTVWGRHCTVSHVFSQFDARGTPGREAGWTLYFTLAAEEMGREAGTAGAFVMPAAHSYAVTPPASVAGPVTQRLDKTVQQVGEAVQYTEQVADVVREVAHEAPASYSLHDPSTHFVRPAAAFDWALSQKLDQTFPISLNSPTGFAEAVRADLQAIYNKPTGRKLIDSLQASGKKISIQFNESNGAAFPHFADDPYGEREPDWEPAFLNEAGTAPGAGLAMNIRYNPFRETVGAGTENWHKRPPGVGLAHELIHAEQAAHGRMIRGSANNTVNKTETQPSTVHAYELETIGVPPYNTYAVSENKIRTEWDPTQPLRTHY